MYAIVAVYPDGDQVCSAHTFETHEVATSFLENMEYFHGLDEDGDACNWEVRRITLLD